VLLLLPLFASLAVVFLVITFWIGRRIGAPLRTGLVALALLAAIWLGAITLMSRGWKDIDGWIDCNDYCHGWHYFGAFLFWTPLVAGTLLLLVFVPTAVMTAFSRLESSNSPSDDGDT
jgi:uncharacterized membrane protein